MENNVLFYLLMSSAALFLIIMNLSIWWNAKKIEKILKTKPIEQIFDL